jgi:hypothetical protein
MNPDQYPDIRRMPRELLEAYAVSAAIRIQQDRREKAAAGTFLSILIGFMGGTLIAVAAFLTGSYLN